MSVRLLLTGPSVRPWHRAGCAHATGIAYTDSGPLSGAALAAYLDGPAESFLPRLCALSGHFAAVLETGDGSLAAVDRIRSIPLFYARMGKSFALGTDARKVARAVGARLDDPAAAAELLLASAVVGGRTLSRGIRQVQAGEVVRLEGDTAWPTRYFRYASGPPLAAAPDELEAEAVAGLERAFEAFLASVRGQPVAVPLSGGFDSRLIAALLARGGRTDAVCYTYGRRSAFEVRASRRIAQTLGLRWHFVPYSARRWRAWAASDGFQVFRRSAAFTTIEHEQDWPAVQALVRSGAIPEGAAVVPGHAGDFLGGSHLPPEPVLDPVPAVWQRYYTEWPTAGLAEPLRQELRARIAEACQGLEGEAAFTAFGWQERQAKMIAHSVRVYEHLGLDWRLPFWADAKVLDFWGRVPLPLRQGGVLYHRVLRRLLGDLYDLPSTHRPVAPWRGKLQRGLDADFRRHGIWLGAAPEVRGLFIRIGDLVGVDHPVVGPVVRQVTGPVAGRPPQWASVNGLLALAQLRDLATEWG
jgi:asparagine synthase (glutamine-hydrolysing)